MELAVKCVTNPSAAKQLKDELMIHAKLEHKNVVLLVGFCNNDGWFRRGRRGLYVCYELMSNGPLGKHIFGTSASLSLCWSCSSHVYSTHTLATKQYNQTFIYVLHLCICLFAHWIVYVYWSASSGQSVIEWPIRYEIIRGICAGLQYLHQDSNSNILHMDLKPSKILLNDEMVPKIAHFCLSRAFQNNKKTHTYTKKVIGSK